MTPRVTVGVPVYNGEKYLRVALDSILGQDFGDFELIISDNASTDGTQDICNEYVELDRRIKYSRLPENLGAAQNYNRLVRMAAGELFKWAAHDDVLRPAFLSRCVAAFDGFETPPSIVYPRAEFIDEDGLVIRPDTDGMHADSDQPFIRAFKALQAMNMTSPVAGVFHKETLLRTRLIGSFISSDYVLLLESALLGKVIQLDGESLFQRRIHEDMSRKANVSSQDVLRWFDPRARLTGSPKMKLYREYLRAPVRLAELSRMEKALCSSSIVSGVMFKRTRVQLGRIRRRLFSTNSGKND